MFGLDGDISDLSQFDKRLKTYRLLGYMLYPVKNWPTQAGDALDSNANRRNQLLAFHIAGELEKASKKKSRKRRVKTLLTLFFSVGGFSALRRANSRQFLNKTKLREIWTHWQFAYTGVDLNYRYANSDLGKGRTLSINKTNWATIGLNDCRKYTIPGGRDALIEQAPTFAAVGHLITSALWIVGPEQPLTLSGLRMALSKNFPAFIGGCRAAAPIADALLKKRKGCGKLLGVGDGTTSGDALPLLERGLNDDERWILDAYDSTLHMDIAPTNPSVARYKAAKAKRLKSLYPPSRLAG